MPTSRATPRSSPPLGPLLFECARLLDEIAQAEVNRQAGTRLLTPALARLLPYLSTTGVRPSEIAKRIDVSKQAVAQALATLRSLGFVAMTSDSADGRARLVRLTPRGLAAYEQGRSVLAFFERGLRNRVGSRRVDELRDTLDLVRAVLLDWTANGAPQESTPSVPAVAQPGRPRQRRQPERR